MSRRGLTRARSGAILTCALALLVAAPARAAFDVTAFSVTPTTTAAGAHADVTIAASFPAYDAAAPPQRPRTLVFHLPPGLAGDPFATPRCAEASFRADTCPANTRIGTVAASATALLGPIPVPQDVTGDLYNVVPAGDEPARLGAVLRSIAGKLYVPTTITARASDGGLDATVPDLPTELGSLPIHTSRLSFTLQGRPAEATGPFMRNPTSCAPATSTLDAIPYGAPATPVARTSSFTPTDCAALPFTPQISGTIGARGLTAAHAHPPLTTVITQPAGQAGQRAVAVALPSVIGPDLTQLGRACPAAQVAAATCPESARVGRAEATTPLLARPLTGNVYLAAGAPGTIPGLAIQLGAPIPLRLGGSVELTPSGLRTTFTGLPDVPLSRFVLSLDGGPSGIFVAGPDLCALEAPPVVGAAYTAQSGAQSAGSAELARVGCTAAPAVSGKLWHLRSGRPVLRVTVGAGADAPDLGELRVLLPDRLEVKRKRKAKGARVTAGGRRLARSAFRLKRDGELRATLPAGTRTVTVKLAKGVLRAGRKLRRTKRPKRMAVTVLVRDGDGPRPATKLRLRPQRR